MFTPRFLVVSLGNPAPYENTLHSAGHIALSALKRSLPPDQPPFSASQRLAGQPALNSQLAKYTFIHSPTFMNTSGPWVARAWREALTTTRLSPPELGLVLVHDDLEEELGFVRPRDWNSSHRGHNGVKSVHAHLRPKDFPGARWSRISIGIGRPDTRERGDVSDYVLRPMTKHQRLAVLKASNGVFDALMELESQWERQSGNASR